MNDVPVTVVAERVQYIAADGKLITESLEDYTKKNVIRQYATLNGFLNSWTKAERKTVILEELEEQGVLFDALQEQVGKDYDPFDLICHVVYGQPPMSRKGSGDKGTEGDLLHEIRRAGKEGTGCSPVKVFRWRDYRDRGHGSAPG